jgi:hypothetical protein
VLVARAELAEPAEPQAVAPALNASEMASVTLTRAGFMCTQILLLSRA